MTRRLAAAAALAVTVLVPSFAQASPVAVDAGWYGFCFAGVGSSATGGCQNEGIGIADSPFTFTALTSVLLKVTDAFSSGDQFRLNVDGGAFVFDTSLVPVGAPPINNPDAAYASALFSHGSILLPAGNHSAVLTVLQSPFGGGGAYLEVETSQVAPVPEPASMLLLGTGVLGLAANARRRRAARRIA